MSDSGARELRDFKRANKMYSGWPGTKAAAEQRAEDAAKAERMKQAAEMVTKRGPGRPRKDEIID